MNAYLDYMTQVGILLGGEGNSTRHQMEQVLELEIKIANVRKDIWLRVTKCVYVLVPQLRSRFLPRIGEMMNNFIINTS